MVRLVFRPYTQLRRSICTSESLRTSTRVSSGFILTRHSSPSFGSQHVCSRYLPTNNHITTNQETPPWEGIYMESWKCSASHGKSRACAPSRRSNRPSHEQQVPNERLRRERVSPPHYSHQTELPAAGRGSAQGALHSFQFCCHFHFAFRFSAPIDSHTC